MKNFALAMIVGIFEGTYSTMFIASPIVLEWENMRDRRRKRREREKYGFGAAERAAGREGRRGAAEAARGRPRGSPSVQAGCEVVAAAAGASRAGL